MENISRSSWDAAKKPRSFPGIFRINPNWLGVFIGNFNDFLEVLQVEVFAYLFFPGIFNWVNTTQLVGLDEVFESNGRRGKKIASRKSF